MKQSLTTTFLILSFQFCFSQSIIGTWYLTHRNGLVEFSITKNTIETRQLFSDFKQDGVSGQRYTYIKTVKLKDRILVIGKSQRDTTKFEAFVFINLTDKKYCQMAWNVPDTLTDDIETLVRIHKNDNRQLFGYYLFSEHYVDSLKHMKSIDSLSLTDYKSYLNVYNEKVKLTQQDNKKYNTSHFSVRIYPFQLMTESLFDIGVNPLQNEMTIDSVYKKYSEDPAVKNLIYGAGQK